MRNASYKTHLLPSMCRQIAGDLGSQRGAGEASCDKKEASSREPDLT